MDLFDTEGIRYAGSKKALLPYIHNIIVDLPVKTVLDGFSGSTRVSQYLKKAGYSVCSNDLSVYSKTLATCYLTNKKYKINKKLSYLNNLKPEKGWYTKNYGGRDKNGVCVSHDGKKKPWQQHNTMKLDAIRPQIDAISSDEIERCILLTSLILALDKVENTLGHQVAYLSKWSPRSYDTMYLQKPKIFYNTKPSLHTVYQKDVSRIKQTFDLAYLDPPYNTNNIHTKTTRVRYASYYHLWTTIVKHDSPDLVGASNRRYDCSSDRLPSAISNYEHIDYSIVYNEFKKLLGSVDSKYLLLSYSNKGKLSYEDLYSLMASQGKVRAFYIPHRENVQKLLTTTKNYLGDTSTNIEYLLLLRRK